MYSRYGKGVALRSSSRDRGELVDDFGFVLCCHFNISATWLHWCWRLFMHSTGPYFCLSLPVLDPNRHLPLFHGNKPCLRAVLGLVQRYGIVDLDPLLGIGCMCCNGSRHQVGSGQVVACGRMSTLWIPLSSWPKKAALTLRLYSVHVGAGSVRKCCSRTCRT